MNQSVTVPQTTGVHLNTLSAIADIPRSNLSQIFDISTTNLGANVPTFAPNVDEWRYAIFHMWRDQLRDAQTMPVIGESLQAGDLVVAAGTRDLFKLIEPLNTMDYFGRTLTKWRVVNVNSPRGGESVEPFYAQRTYEVLPKGG